MTIKNVYCVIAAERGFTLIGSSNSVEVMIFTEPLEIEDLMNF